MSKFDNWWNNIGCKINRKGTYGEVFLSTLRDAFNAGMEKGFDHATCVDCKYSCPDEDKIEGWRQCSKFDTGVGPDFYCANWESKE